MSTERASARDLLEAQHDFPGPFEFRLVVQPEARASVVTAIAAVVAAVGTVSQRESKKGTYLSIRVEAQVDSADQVLDVWEVLKGLDGVIMSL